MLPFGISKNPSKYRLKQKRGSDLEFEESTPFMVNDADRVFRDNEHINSHSKTASAVVIVLIGLLVAQTFRLQVINRKEFSALAENNRVKEITTRADRGIIYDKKGSVLVKNDAIFDLVAIPQELPKDSAELKRLSAEIALVTGKDESSIAAAIDKVNRNAFHPELILENIGISEAISFETQKGNLPGIEVSKNAIRSYPDAKYFSQIIGYTGRVSVNDLISDGNYEPSDFVGKTGLESYYEKDLRGKKGNEKVEVDAKGKVIAIMNKTDNEAGKNLVLSINADLQKKLQNSLAAEMEKIDGRKRSDGGAAAVAMDPRNGKILALVSLPTYDNNIFSNPGFKNERSLLLNDLSFPMLNRAISGRYPPGSTIKPVMGIAALSEGIANENTVIVDKGVIDVFYYGIVTHFFGWNRGGLGPMNIISAIAKSSDIYFYTVGGGFGDFKGLGVDKIGEYFRKFNLGKKLGIDLPNEVGGLVPTKEYKKAKFGEDWNLGNTYHLSIGQGYLETTPLQVASWTSVFANGGTLYKPQIVDKFTNGDMKDVDREVQPEIIDTNLADKKYMDIARRGMREVVLNGTAGSLKSVGVPVAGKTGTAQFGTKGKTHSWFTSFAPYDNPEIVLTVLIEGGGEGSSTAVPIVRDVLKWYFNGEKDEIIPSPTFTPAPTLIPVPSPDSAAAEVNPSGDTETVVNPQ